MSTQISVLKNLYYCADVRGSISNTFLPRHGLNKYIRETNRDLKRHLQGVPTVAQWKWIWLATMRLQVQSLVSLSGLRVWCCHELWCRLQTWLRSHVAVAMVYNRGYSSDWTPSLGTSICRECGPEKQKRICLLSQLGLYVIWFKFMFFCSYVFMLSSHCILLGPHPTGKLSSQPWVAKKDTPKCTQTSQNLYLKKMLNLFF